MTGTNENIPEVTVKLFAHFRESAGNVKEVIIAARTVGELVDELMCRFEGLKGQISKDGKLRPYVNIMVNGVSISDLNGMDTKLNPDCEVAIFPPVSGG